MKNLHGNLKLGHSDLYSANYGLKKSLISRQWFDLSDWNFVCVYILDRFLVHMTGGATYINVYAAEIHAIISGTVPCITLKFCMCIDLT